MSGDVHVVHVSVTHTPTGGLVCSVLLSPLLQARTDLENHSVDAATTSEAVVFITLLQGLKRNMRTWEQSVEVCNMH